MNNQVNDAGSGKKIGQGSIHNSIKLITPRGIVMLLVPLIGLIVALTSKNILILDYVHVISGGTWTGIDVYMAFVMAFVFRFLNPVARSEIARRMTPLTLFLLPSLATTAITAGIYLAKSLGIFNIHSPLIISAGVIVIILVIQGFGIFLPNEVRVFLELRKESPDVTKISKLMMRVFKLASIQGILQIILIFVMANLAMG